MPWGGGDRLTAPKVSFTSFRAYAVSEESILVKRFFSLCTHLYEVINPPHPSFRHLLPPTGRKEKCAFTLAEGATHVKIPTCQRKIAFTLAEVLVTLGIIGVIAAMTMPVLIAMHRKAAVEVAVEKFYTNMNQAIKLSEINYGDKEGWSFPSDNSKEALKEWYDTYLDKNLITTDVKFEDGLTVDGDKYDTLTIYFPDGSIDMVTYRGHDHYFCANGSKFQNQFKSGNSDLVKKENGRNCFGFGFYPSYGYSSDRACISDNYNKKGLEPYMGSEFDCDGFEDMEKLAQKGHYAKILQRNGWHFPKDYPLKF